MVRMHSLSFYVMISISLHALLAGALWEWPHRRADVYPCDGLLRVSIVQAPAAMRSMARYLPAAPAAGTVRSVKSPLPVEEPMYQIQTAPQPLQQDQTDSAGSTPGVGAGTDAATGIPGPGIAVSMGTAGTENFQNAERALADAREAYTRELYQIIRKYFVYPTLARRRGEEGQVQMSFIVGADGRARNIEVVASSGYRLLDRAALETIRKLPLPPPPPGVMQVPLTIVYRLEEGA